MFPAVRRAWARHLSVLALLLVSAAHAQRPDAMPDEAPELSSERVSDVDALDLAEAANLAVEAQPLLQSLEARTRAARSSAIAERQLPDPQLRTGIIGLPINTDTAGSITRDSDTQLQLGLSQAFVRAEKRRLRGDLYERESSRLEAERDLIRRTIRRDAALDYLDLWRNTRRLDLIRASLTEAEAQAQRVEIGLRTGSATQAEFLAARMEADRLRDEAIGAQQGIAQARNALSRWIGDAAQRPVSSALSDMPELPGLEVTLARVRSHPLLARAAAEIAAAQTGADLAQAAYKPDWRVELGYGYRPEFSEMAMLQVGVDLPVFTRNRQDQSLAASLAQADAASFAAEDVRRQLVAEARLNHRDYEQLVERLDEFDRSLRVDSRHRVAAALAGWRSGRNALREVLDARRAALDVEIARLDLQLDLARRRVQLTYLGAFEDAAGNDVGENAHE